MLAFTLSLARRRAAQDGDLPLHCAAVGNASEAVVAALLAAYPEAAKEKNEVRPQRPPTPPHWLRLAGCLRERSHSPAAALRRIS